MIRFSSRLWLTMLLLLPAVVFAKDDARAFMLAASCAACHGTGGNSPGAIPTLKGKDKNYIVRALNGFKSGTRPATVMNRLAKGYSDSEIQLLANWFATHNQEARQ